jgi:hypothetical protein
MADDADDQTTDRFLEVYLLWLFGWVLFRESAGDFMSRCMIPWCDNPPRKIPYYRLNQSTLVIKR